MGALRSLALLHGFVAEQLGDRRDLGALLRDRFRKFLAVTGADDLGGRRHALNDLWVLGDLAYVGGDPIAGGLRHFRGCEIAYQSIEFERGVSLLQRPRHGWKGRGG